MPTPRKQKPATPAGKKGSTPRPYVVKIYVSEREQTQIRLAATASNLSMTEFCREALKDKVKAAIKTIASFQDD
jgi:hypothetical protein